MKFLLAIVLGMLVTGMAVADPPRERLLMDFNWRFHPGDAPDAGTRFDYPEVKDLAKTRGDQMGQEGNLAADPPDAVTAEPGNTVSFVQPGFDDHHWRQLDLPHDWAVELPFDPKADLKHGFKPIGPGFPENSIGWYRREFHLPESDKGKTLWVEFDGVYRNSLVWLNGHCLGRHLDGYSGFRYDISRFANCGGRNELVVRVDASRFEGWFYEGAGIYRHVWLVKTSLLHIAPGGVFVWSTFPKNVPAGPAVLHYMTTVANLMPARSAVEVNWTIIAPDGKTLEKSKAHEASEIRSGAETEFSGDMEIPSPALWSPESPKLYRLVTTVKGDGEVRDQTETCFGIRTIAFDAAKGFLLNGRPYLIKGTCNHQDHAGVGTALPDALQYFRLKKLKAMGCNAIRTSHNPPTPALLDACDRLGLLVMDENRRMDDGSWELGELQNLILRDRNHASVFIWSLANEEPLQGTNTGAQAITVMQNLAHQLDPTRPCTVAMNGKWGLGFSAVIDVQGFNYGTKKIDDYHAKHPAQPEIGTETASTVGSRGVYADDKARGYVSAYGEYHPGWGAKPWEWWSYFAAHPFAGGGFVWTGFDYRGEPTPCEWPCINSHFGILDSCGFPKDIYYYYQAWWTDKPVLHLMPHWNWPDKIGQEILVRVFSNCQEVELFLNGKSLGRQTMKPDGYLDWQVKYEPGVLSAQGRDRGERVMETLVETTGAPAAIELSSDRSIINAGGEDVSLVTVSVTDAKGRAVPTVGNLIHFKVSGAGKIIGVGNGDPGCHEADKCIGRWQRSAFNGLAQVIVQSARQPGTIKLTAFSPGLRAGTSTIRSEARTLPLVLP